MKTMRFRSSILKIGGGTMTLLRKALPIKEQRFEGVPAYEHLPPYGNITTSVRTEALSVDYGEVAGRIDIRYDSPGSTEPSRQNVSPYIEIEEDHGL